MDFLNENSNFIIRIAILVVVIFIIVKKALKSDLSFTVDRHFESNEIDLATVEVMTRLREKRKECEILKLGKTYSEILLEGKKYKVKIKNYRGVYFYDQLIILELIGNEV